MVGTFSEKKIEKINQKEFRFEKLIKAKGDKRYLKWKCRNRSFNIWIEKKDIV